jgi:hypothetical protein
MNMLRVVDGNAETGDSHVKHGINPFKERGHFGQVSDIRLMYMNPRIPLVMLNILPLPCREIINNDYFIIRGYKLVNHVAANEPGATGYDNPTVSQFHEYCYLLVLNSRGFHLEPGQWSLPGKSPRANI